jgi:hypothetical protein
METIRQLSEGGSGRCVRPRSQSVTSDNSTRNHHIMPVTWYLFALLVSNAYAATQTRSSVSFSTKNSFLSLRCSFVLNHCQRSFLVDNFQVSSLNRAIVNCSIDFFHTFSPEIRFFSPKRLESFKKTFEIPFHETFIAKAPVCHWAISFAII